MNYGIYMNAISVVGSEDGKWKLIMDFLFPVKQLLFGLHKSWIGICRRRIFLILYNFKMKI